MKKFALRALGTLVGLIVLLAIGALAYVQHPKFGELPEGEHRAAIQQSPNYADGEFRNLVDTPLFTQDKSFMAVLLENLRESREKLSPASDIPARNLDFKALDVQQDLVVWLGHSSYYVQLGGKRILIDPVFSEAASPLPFINLAFAGTTLYSAEDMPPIDVLLISHDHWDHLDYPSVLALKPKVAQVIAGLGVGSYFQGWGYDPGQIREGDWYQSFTIGDGLEVEVIPARHYSGRLLERRQTLWVGFILQTPERRLLFSGDSGYGPHFADIGQRVDGFDLVALDHGQYDDRWAYIHMTPEEAARAADELGAARFLPGHVGRFALARHPWDEPFNRIVQASEGRNYELLTPLIGEPVWLSGQTPQNFSAWWQ